MPNDEQKKTKSALKPKALLLLGLTCLLIVSSYFLSKYSGIPEVTVNSATLSVEIADSNTERAKGLCCRSALPENEGMLFIYKESGNYSFWMKDTLIPLDIIWINSDKNIVHIEHNVEPSSYPQSFGSPKPAQYILEANAGWAKEKSIKIGDPVSF